MTNSVNKVILIGFVGKKPEIRTSSAGKEIAMFSIATSEKKDKTNWHRIIVFNEALVELVKNFINQGSNIYLEGALQTRKWTDKTGVDKYITEVVLQGYNSRVIVLDSKNNQSIDNTVTEKEFKPIINFDPIGDEDELPF